MSEEINNFPKWLEFNYDEEEGQLTIFLLDSTLTIDKKSYCKRNSLFSAIETRENSLAPESHSKESS